jgi:hypothetical protein
MRPFASFTKLWAVIDWLGTHTAIPEKWVTPVASIQYGYGTEESPNFTNVRLRWFEGNTGTLYWNGILFLRLMFPLFLGFQFRWSKTRLMQMHFGWKMNGNWAMGFYWAIFLWPLLYFFGWHWYYLFLFFMIRFQTDASAMAGMDIPNPWEASGFADGPH